MNLQAITDAANAFTDESFKATIVIHYVNEAIGMINAEVKATLPFFQNSTSDYTALSETWIRTLFIPYASYGIKQNDGSLNEASIFLRSFNTAFMQFLQAKTLAIPLAYQSEDFGGIYVIDPSNAINIGWFHSTTDDDGFE